MSARGILFLAAVASLTSATEASAYLDPGTGSILLQGVIGGAMATLFFLRRHWQTLRRRIGGGPANADEKRSDASETP